MKRLSFLLLLLVAAAMAAAQDSLSLYRCRQLALQHNRRISSAAVRQDQATYTLQAARANFFPDIKFSSLGMLSTASGSFNTPASTLPVCQFSVQTGGYVPMVMADAQGNVLGLSQFAEFPAMQVKYDMHRFFNTSLVLTQPLYMGGKVQAAYRMAKIGRQMAEQNRQLTAQEVLTEVDEAYSLLVKAHETAGVARAYRLLLAELERTVESAVRHGMRTRNDLLKVQVSLNRSQLDVTRADHAEKLARMNLCHIIGLPLDSAVCVAAPEWMEISSQAESAVDKGADASALELRPEFAMLEQQTQMARQQVKLTRADFLPQLAAFATGGYACGGKVKVDATTALAGTQTLYDHTLTDKFSASAGVSLSIPIFHFGERRGKIRSAKAALRMAEIDCADKTEQMQLELAQACNTLDEQLSACRIATLSVEQAAENLRLSRSAYDAGTETMSDLLEAQALWQQAKAEEIDAHARLIQALSRWQKAAGRM
ncbi:MAG: TolC family protein [Prevotella sp.]